MNKLLIAAAIASASGLCAAKNKDTPPPVVYAQTAIVAPDFATGVSRFAMISTTGQVQVCVATDGAVYGRESCAKWAEPAKAIPSGKTYVGMQLMPVDRRLEMMVYWK